jgi:hypothetical protein
MMNRTPPKVVMEFLRREVNFGCPVPKCGIPYLTWHHFDPPWSIKEHHNPGGMIALCAKHAALADAGRYLPEQLRQMKTNPFITSSKITQNYDYLRRNVVCIIGNIAYKVQTVLEINGESVIWFNVDTEGYNRLNLLIRDKNGEPILTMEDNFWTALGMNLFDLRCSLRGKTLEVISKDKKTTFSIRFDDYPLLVFKEKILSYYQQGMRTFSKNGLLTESATAINEITNQIAFFIAKMGSPVNVPTLSIKGKLLSNGVHLKIGEGYITTLSDENIYGMNLIFGGKTAFSLDSNSVRFGVI